MEKNNGKFINFYISNRIYRKDFALTFGVFYYTKFGKSMPVFGFQFGKSLGDSRYEWDRNYVYFFHTFGLIHSFYYKLKKCIDYIDIIYKSKNITVEKIDLIKKKTIFKFVNPSKKRSCIFGIADNVSIDEYNSEIDKSLGMYMNFKISDTIFKFVLTRSEAEMLYLFVKQIVENYLLISLTARITFITSSNSNGLFNVSKENDYFDDEIGDVKKDNEFMSSKDNINESISIDDILEDGFKENVIDDDVPF